MKDHRVFDHTEIDQRGTAAGEQLHVLQPVDLRTESSPWHDPTVSKIRVVSVGVAGPTQEITLADLLEFEPAAGTSVVLCELERCP